MTKSRIGLITTIRYWTNGILFDKQKSSIEMVFTMVLQIKKQRETNQLE